MWGDVKFDKKGKKINQTLSGFSQGIVNQAQGFANEGMNSPLRGLGMGFQQQGANDTLGAYGALNAYGLPDEGLYQNAMGGMQNYSNLFGGLAGAAAQNPYAQQQMQLGLGFMGAQPQSYQDVAASRLGLLRDQAAPFEERAYNSLQNRMFSQGRMGSTGGGRDLEAFSRGLAQADTGRQLDAQQLAEGLYGRDLQAALQQQGMGANLFSGGAGNWMSGLTNAADIGRLGMGATTGMYDLGMGWNQAGYGRAQDRLARTTQMFGFGGDVAQTGLRDTAGWMDLMSGISGEQAKSADLGLRAAGSGQPTGGNPMGAAAGGFLQGLGGGMLTGQIKPGEWFNKPPSGGTGTGTTGFGFGGTLGTNSYGGGDWSSFFPNGG